MIGSEFYVMERVAGHIPRKDLGIDLSAERGPRAVRERARPIRRPALGRPRGGRARVSSSKGDGYVARQVGGWIAPVQEGQDLERPVVAEGHAAGWKPTSPRSRRLLIHNDFRFDNIVLDETDPTKPIALLDWEMATIGDPLMDLGGTMAVLDRGR